MSSYSTPYINPINIIFISNICNDYSFAEKCVFNIFNHFRIVNNREFFQINDIENVKIIINNIINNINNNVLTPSLLMEKNKINNIPDNNKKKISFKNINNNIINLLNLDFNNLSEFELLLVSNDKLLKKHFNLRLLLYNNIHDNLFIETIKNKYTKINICKNIMNLLHINDLSSINKNISVHFNDIIEDLWIKDNIQIITPKMLIMINILLKMQCIFNRILIIINILGCPTSPEGDGGKNF